MAGKIVADTLEHSTAGSIATNYVVEGSAKAWCHWTEITTTAINGSFAVSSIADEGTGQTGINLQNAMTANEYAITFSTNVADAGGFDASTIGTTTKTTHQTRSQSGSDFDANVACMICVGDLA